MNDKKKIYFYAGEPRKEFTPGCEKKRGEDRIFVFAAISGKQGSNMARVVSIDQTNADWSPVADPAYNDTPNMKADSI